MQKRFALMFVVIVVVVVLFFLGSGNLDKTISVGSCSAKFATEPVTVTSELCGAKKTCVASPEAQQNNAVVDVLLCACDKAKTGSYADAGLNKGIEKVVSGYFNYTLSAQAFCDQPVLLVKRSYG